MARMAPMATFGLTTLLAVAGCKSDGEAADSAAASAEPAAASAAPDPPKEEPKEEEADAGKAEAEADASDSKAEAKPDAAAKPKVNPSVAAAAGIQRCCNALSGAAAKGGPHQQKYQTAAGVCSGMVAQIKAGRANPAAVRTTLRAQLRGAPAPGGC